MEKLKLSSKLDVALIIDSSLSLPLNTLGTTPALRLNVLINAIFTRFREGIDEDVASKLGDAIASCLSKPTNCEENLKNLAEELFEKVRDENYSLKDSEEWYRLVDEFIEVLREATRAEVVANFIRNTIVTTATQLGVNPADPNVIEKIEKKLKKLGADTKVVEELKRLKKLMEENEKRAKELHKKLDELEKKINEALSIS